MISWTKHAKEKMKFYGLSERRLKKVLGKPDRKEKGIAPGTVALMKKAGTEKNPYEIWVMYQRIRIKNKRSESKSEDRKIKIISVWKYPGKSPVEELPIPKDVPEDFKRI